MTIRTLAVLVFMALSGWIAQGQNSLQRSGAYSAGPVELRPRALARPAPAPVRAQQKPTEKWQDVDEALSEIFYDGQSYSHARLIKVGQVNGLVRLPNGGLVSIPLRDLPEPHRSKYFDPETESAFKAKSQKDPNSDIRKQLIRERLEWIKGQNPFRVIDGKLFDFTEMINDIGPGGIDPSDYYFKRFYFSGTVFQVAPDGLLVDVSTSRYDVDLIFVRNASSQDHVIDGSRVRGIAMRTGRYQYVSVRGATKTIPLMDAGMVFNPQNEKFTTGQRLTRIGMKDFTVENNSPKLWLGN